MQWVWLIFIRIVLHCLPCLWLWLHHPCISTHSNVLGRKHFGNTQCLAGIETLSSITSAVKTSSKAQGSFAESCATSNYWKLVEEDERGVEMEELHCDHYSHPPLSNAAPFSLPSYWSALVSWENPGFWLVERGMGDLGELCQSCSSSVEGGGGTWHWSSTTMRWIVVRCSVKLDCTSILI